MEIREIRESDAEAFLGLCRRLDQETRFMLFEPGERGSSVEEQRAQIKNILAGENQTLLVAQEGRDLVGYIAAIGGSVRRTRHRAHIVVGVLQEFTGRGIGTRLFQEAEKWAREKRLRRLELTVMVHNERAIRLYKKQGFAIEGVKKDSLLIEEAYVDEYYMARLLT